MKKLEILDNMPKQDLNPMDKKFDFDWIHGTVEELESFVQAHSPNVYIARGIITVTPLLETIFHDRFDLMEVLLEAKADPNMDLYNNPAIIVALEHRLSPKYIEKLLEFGATLDGHNSKKQGAVEIAISFILLNLDINLSNREIEDNFEYGKKDYNMAFEKMKLVLKNNADIPANTIEKLDKLIHKTSDFSQVNEYAQNIKIEIENEINNRYKIKKQQQLNDRNEKAKEFRKYAKARFKGKTH